MIILCIIFVILIIIGAFIRIPVPIVPFTLQFFFITLAGLLLGPKYGCISVCIYTVLGLLGVPVFADGGGISYVLQPSFGYLIGFALGAFVTGKIANHTQEPSYKRLLIANFTGLGIIYLIGMIYYYIISNFYLGASIGVWPVLLYCFILAVPGDILLCGIAAIIGKKLIPLMRMQGIGCK